MQSKPEEAAKEPAKEQATTSQKKADPKPEAAKKSWEPQTFEWKAADSQAWKVEMRDLNLLFS